MSLKFWNVCIIVDNSLFSSEPDFGLTRLSKVKNMFPYMIRSINNHSISCKYTLICSKNGLPYAPFIGISSSEEAFKTLQLIQPETGKYPMIDCISLTSSICVPNNLIKNHIIIVSCSPLFSDSSLSWTSVIEKLQMTNAFIRIISLCGEVHALKTVAEKTKGQFWCLSETDGLEDATLYLEERSMQSSNATLLCSGLADYNFTSHSTLIGKYGTFSHEVLQSQCPRCFWTQGHLPQECPCCGLLVTSEIADVLAKPKESIPYEQMQKPCEADCFCCQEVSILRHSCLICKIQVCLVCFENINKNWSTCPGCNYSCSKEL